MKTIANLFFGIAVFSLISSCKKQLDQKPTDSILQENAFTSVSDLEKGLLSVYAANNPINKIYIASLLSDEVRLSNENRGQGQSTFKFQYSASGGEHNADFSRGYVTLDYLHRVLAAIDKVPTKTSDEEVRKKIVKAELLGLRGVTYYELLIQFMPSGYNPGDLAVPIILKSDVFATPARSKVSEVVAQIETDLSAARGESSLPDAPSGDDIHICKAAIAAYQARLALLKKEWTSAITYATDAITLSGKTIADATSGADFSNYWKDANDIETIWQYKNQTAPQLLWRDTNGDVFFEPSVGLKNKYNRSNDYRTIVYFGASGADTSIIKKYPGSSLGAQINTLKIVRMSEMLLLRAEAYAENNQLAEAAADVNLLRANRIVGYIDETFADTQSAIDVILTERTKELCFEGFRFFDLKRRGLGVQRLAVDVQSSNWQTLPANNFRFALPIPSSEMLANPNEKQNPGY